MGDLQEEETCCPGTSDHELPYPRPKNSVSGAFSAARREHWAEAGSWLFFTLTLGALPFWGTALIYWLFSQELGYGLFDGAELAIYSAGLLASAIPIMQRETKDSPFKHPRWFLAIALFVLVIAALVFASVTIADQAAAVHYQRPAVVTPQWNRLFGVSVVLVLSSLTLAFFTELINNIRQDVNYRRIREAEVNVLDEKVRQKLEAHASD